MKFIHSFVAKVLGKNLESTPKEVIIDQMAEPRPLPMGRTEFEEWSNRIISGALIPGKNGSVLQNDPAEHWAHIESQKFTLAGMLLHLGPTESHKPDAFFIHSLRKVAINQVAVAMIDEIKAAKNKRIAEEEKKDE